MVEQHLRKSQKVGNQIEKSKPKPRKKSIKEESTCPVCYKLFDKKSNMTRHVKQEHEQEGRYPCDKCEKSYDAKISLEHHKNTKHPDKSPGDKPKMFFLIQTKYLHPHACSRKSVSFVVWSCKESLI